MATARTCGPDPRPPCHHLGVVALAFWGLFSPAASAQTRRQGRLAFDPVAGKMAPVQAVVIDGDKVVAVGTPGKPVEIPKGARVIDATGKFILPGLIDAHVHLVHRLNFAM